MTRRRSHVVTASVLAATAVVGLASGCGGAGKPANQVYVRLECGKCHGQHREGSRTAPPLTGLASRWTEDGLVAYFRDPQGVTRDTPRITLRNEQYPLKMPSYAAASEEDLTRLARYLLSG